MEHARRDELEPYVTRDGSTITAGSGLVVVCACALAYSHEDTVLLEGE